MLIFSAQAFWTMSMSIERLRASCGGVEGQLPIAGNVKPVLLEAFETFIESCKGIALEMTASMAEKIVNQLRDGKLNHGQFGDRLDLLQDLIESEMKQHRFVYITPKNAKFFPSTAGESLFGEAVAKNFPSAAYEIEQSSVCLGLGLSTASVFHSMRILEIGLVVLGKEFSIALNGTSWGLMLDQIELAIKGIHNNQQWTTTKPDWKDLEIFYSQAATHFVILNNAWRNITMHTTQKYTEDEAERIFVSVRSFMQKLSERLHE
jgi:hypothetical protein